MIRCLQYRFGTLINVNTLDNLRKMVDVLDELQTVTVAIRERDELAASRNRLIVEARKLGASISQIQAITGLSRQSVANAEQRGKKALDRSVDGQ